MARIRVWATYRGCEDSGNVSNARLSPATRMPERKHIDKFSRGPIVDVVPHTGQDYPPHALGTAATSRCTYARLRTQHIQHLGKVVMDSIRRR
jgi:hypothetical protein